MAFVTFECRGCGAGVQSPPDNLLVVCAHCGDRYPSRELKDSSVAMIPSMKESEIRRAVEKRMENDEQMKSKDIQMGSAEGIYVPIFVQSITTTIKWDGYKHVNQNNTRVKEFLAGQKEYQIDYPILGRKHAHEFGMECIGFVLPKQKYTSFDDIDWKTVHLPLLAVDVDKSLLTTKVQAQLTNHLGLAIQREAKLSALTSFDVDIQSDSCTVVFFPFWTVKYLYRGSEYRVAVSGGDGRVLGAIEPIVLSDRIGFWCKSIFGIVLAGVFTSFIGPVLALEQPKGFVLVLLIFVAVSLCAYFAWEMLHQIQANQRVERMGHFEDIV